MSRSRFLVVAVAFSLAACHSGEEPRDPSSHAQTTSADSRAAFPADDARTALNAASHGLKSCRAAEGPAEVDAAVKFEPSGKVTKVDVTPAAEPVASCVKTKLADVSVMPFAGEPVTMSMRVRL